MSARPPRLPTFDELYRQIAALPEHVTGQILRPGVLTTMSRPGVAHQLAESMIEEAVRSFDAKKGGRGWWILREVEVRFPVDLLAVPDLAGWRVETVPELPRDNPLLVVPEWCCEVLSRSTEKDDRLLKLQLYADAGVRWTWLVDPDLGTVEVFEAVAHRPVRVAFALDHETPVLPPFEVITEIGRWWMPTPAAATVAASGIVGSTER